MGVKNNLRQIGYFTGTKGIKGDLKFYLDQMLDLKSDFTNQFIFIKTADNGFLPYEVKKISYTNKTIILTLEGINSINDAEKITKKAVFMDEKGFLQHFDVIIDYTTYTMYENGLKLSPILDVMDNGKYQLFQICAQDKKVWVPNVPRYIKQIDDDKKTIEMIDSEVLI